MKEVAIQVSHVSKLFKLPTNKQHTLKGRLVSLGRSGKQKFIIQEALKDVDFEIYKGEFFGIVGKNGGGKSTLLKMIAGIYKPTRGTITVNGTLTPFIELGVGFNPELTGRENVYLNCALLGFNRKQTAKMYDQIVHFAELEKFMDQKLKNYSSGMQVRLAFSIAIRAKTDILILDEVLAVGDAAFQKKCLEVFRDLKRAGRTIVLVTHDMVNVERFCDRALVLNKGNQLFIGSPREAAKIYASLNVDTKEKQEAAPASDSKKVRSGTNQVTVVSAQLSDGKNKTNIFNMGGRIELHLALERHLNYKELPVQIGLSIRNEDGLSVLGPNNKEAAKTHKADKINYAIENVSLKPGKYTITIVVYDADGIDRLDYLEEWVEFTVRSDEEVVGLYKPQDKWEVVES